MIEDDTTESVPLSHYLTVLRRWWWLLLLCVLLGLAGATAYLSLVPQRVTATTTLSVSPITEEPFNLSRSAASLLDLRGEAETAQSFEVAERVAAELGAGATGNEVRQMVEVVALPDTSILRVTATGASEEEGRTVADTVAQEYLGYRAEQAQSTIDRRVEASRARLEALREDLSNVNQRAAVAADSDDDAVSQADSDRSVLTFEINNIVQQVASAEAIDTTPGSVLSPAARNAVTRTPDRGLVLATGALTGLALGPVLALLANALGSKVRGRREIERDGGGAVLGVLSGGPARVPATGLDLEALRAVRERWLAGAGQPEHGVAAVISLCPDGWADDVPFNLAYVIARSGRPVEFVGVGLDARVLSAAHDSDLALEPDAKGPYGDRYVSRSVPHFAVFVPRGEAGARSQDEVLSAGVQEEVAARRDHTLVVLGLPAEATESSRLAATRLSNTTTLVVGQRVTRKRALRQSAGDVVGLGGRLVGSLLVEGRRSIGTGARVERRERSATGHP